MLESGIRQKIRIRNQRFNPLHFWEYFCKNPNPVQKLDGLPTLVLTLGIQYINLSVIFLSLVFVWCITYLSLFSYNLSTKPLKQLLKINDYDLIFIFNVYWRGKVEVKPLLQANTDPGLNEKARKIVTALNKINGYKFIKYTWVLLLQVENCQFRLLHGNHLLASSFIQ